jgi:hypothetical protein
VIEKKTAVSPPVARVGCGGSSGEEEEEAMDPLLQRALEIANRPRAVHQPIDWLVKWRHLAAITSGLTPEDSRLQTVLTALDVCDTAFLAGDYPGFMHAATKVENAMNRR